MIYSQSYRTMVRQGSRKAWSDENKATLPMCLNHQELVALRRYGRVTPVAGCPRREIDRRFSRKSPFPLWETSIFHRFQAGWSASHRGIWKTAVKIVSRASFWGNFIMSDFIAIIHKIRERNAEKRGTLTPQERTGRENKILTDYWQNTDSKTK